LRTAQVLSLQPITIFGIHLIAPKTPKGITPMPKKTPPTTPDIILHPAQAHVFSHRARYTVVACGRRWGKTELGKALVKDHLKDGTQYVWWLAPTYNMASQVWRDLKRHFRPQNNVTISESERRIDFAEGGFLAIRSTHTPDNLRGAGLDFAVLDEAAFMPSDVWSEIVRPMLLDRHGGALFISSPNGKNWFWEVFQLGLGGLADNPQWASFGYATHTNPRLSADDLENIRQTTTERVWRQEYLAEFVDDSGTVFRNIRACATAPHQPVYHAENRYVAGVDWGREGDFTVMVVLNADTCEMVAMTRFNEIGWEFQRNKLQVMCEAWHVDVVIAEANSIGSPNIEALEREGLPIMPFMMTAKSKNPLIESLALALEQQQVRIQDDETLINELSAYSLKRSKTGAWQFGAPSGTHDDSVIALALAWYATQMPRLRLDFV
jgi:phage FluMu gp28-like protein